MATANFEIGNKEFEVRFIRESGYYLGMMRQQNLKKNSYDKTLQNQT